MIVVFGSAGSLLACSGVERDPELNLATSTNPVQSAYVGSNEGDTNKGVHLVKASSQDRKGKSTGAIRPLGSTWSEGHEAPCGMTFISPKYGITAAHCVDSGNLPNMRSHSSPSRFRIEQYNTVNLNLSAVGTQSGVTALYGGWPHYRRNGFLSGTQGYGVTTYTCVVDARCSHGASNCPMTQTVDIAMVYCSSRAWASDNWVRVASADDGNTSDEANASVEVRWFHEVLNLATSSDPFIPYQPDWNYQHYYLYEPGTAAQAATARANNYHYRTVYEDHQYLPLVSKRSAANQPYESTGVDGSYVKTNVPVCHGTSGSGFFRMPDGAQGPAFLGPAVHGYGPGKDGKLCANMNATTATSTYVNATFTRNFEALSRVQSDRTAPPR